MHLVMSFCLEIAGRLLMVPRRRLIIIRPFLVSIWRMCAAVALHMAGWRRTGHALDMIYATMRRR